MKRKTIAIALFAMPISAQAEVEWSFYTGLQEAPPSDISVRDDGVIPNGNFQIAWEGLPLEWPLYAGFRITNWQTATFGWGLDYAHNKTYPIDGELPAGYSALEFTDGLNTWTINGYRRWPKHFGDFTPYVGAGIGLSVPGVEVTYLGRTTFEYQLTGLAVTWLAGASYPINDQWALFGEYKGTFTSNSVVLRDGGTLETDIFTNAINFGVNYKY